MQYRRREGAARQAELQPQLPALDVPLKFADAQFAMRAVPDPARLPSEPCARIGIADLRSAARAAATPPCEFSVPSPITDRSDGCPAARSARISTSSSGVDPEDAVAAVKVRDVTGLQTSQVPAATRSRQHSIENRSARRRQREAAFEAIVQFNLPAEPLPGPHQVGRHRCRIAADQNSWARPAGDRCCNGRQGCRIALDFAHRRFRNHCRAKRPRFSLRRCRCGADDLESFTARRRASQYRWLNAPEQ